jgi:hypothetical protein
MSEKKEITKPRETTKSWRRWLNLVYKTNITNYTQYLAEIEVSIAPYTYMEGMNGSVGAIGGIGINKKLIGEHRPIRLQLQPLQWAQTVAYRDENRAEVYVDSRDFYVRIYLYKKYENGKWGGKSLVICEKFDIHTNINIISRHEHISLTDSRINTPE